MRTKKEVIWQGALGEIKSTVSAAIFSTWFAQTAIDKLSSDDGFAQVAISCPSNYVKATLEVRYKNIITDTLGSILGNKCNVVFLVAQKNNEDQQKKITDTPLFESTKNIDFEVNRLLTRSNIRSGYTFKNFAVSSSNQMAYAAAEAVSKNIGSAYNPLFVWGGVGVGKTHLISAVAHTLYQSDPEAKIYCCTGEDFTNDIVEGIRNKTTQNFRNKYRRLNMLLIDDVQFLAGKDAVQEEFFHTFNAIVGSGGQIILTSDRPPSEIERLAERLRSRFEAGLIVDIGTPDFELRCAIAQIKAKEKGIDLPMDFIQLIAGNLDAARKIEGFLTRLISESRLKNQEITQELIESLLGSNKENLQPIKTNPNELLGAVTRYFTVGKKAITGQSRQRPIALPRQILMYLLRTELSLPYEEIGRLIGNRDHTTVMHAVEKITSMASNNAQVREDIVGIKRIL